MTNYQILLFLYLRFFLSSMKLFKMNNDVGERITLHGTEKQVNRELKPVREIWDLKVFGNGMNLFTCIEETIMKKFFLFSNLKQVVGKLFMKKWRIITVKNKHKW